MGDNGGLMSIKESVLNILNQNVGKTVSGAELAIESFFDGFITIIGTVAAAEFST